MALLCVRLITQVILLLLFLALAILLLAILCCAVFLLVVSFLLLVVVIVSLALLAFPLLALLAQVLAPVFDFLVDDILRLPRRKKHKLDAVLLEVVDPLLATLDGQEIGLIDDEETLLGAVDLLGIGLEIETAEKEGVASINDLANDVGAFHDTPQLTPDFNVLLEGGHETI